jgi:hypothetical protein
LRKNHQQQDDDIPVPVKDGFHDNRRRAVPTT